MASMSTTTKPFDFNRLDEAISVSSHNPVWFQWYEQEVAVLGQVLSGLRPQFAHVGSSAVPGLKAKPIVDILVGIETLAIPPAVQASIENLGYEYFGRLHPSQERLFARKRGDRSFNLQIVPAGAPEWHEKLVFRDFLRARPGEVQEYAAIKDAAVAAGKIRLLDYHRHKDTVVTELLKRALAWDAAGRPTFEE